MGPTFKATDFDELFEGTKAIAWEEVLPRDARFWVTKATTNKSALFSGSAIQSIVKKAIVERMKQTYRVSRFDEDGDEYPIRVFIFKDMVTIGLDTSGVSLHKRGYRQLVGKAPISETLAAALLMLTPWKSDRVLVDPFCGSGTFPIEAALIGANIAPGMNREFTAESWGKLIPKKLWYEAGDEAADMIINDVEMNIQGYDLDPEIVKCAMANARAAGVDKHIHFQARDVKDLRNPKHYGFIVTNPPYGERLEEKEALPELYRTIGESYRSLEDWSMYLITSYEDAEKYIGRKADKNRKIYNGMIKSYFYQFMGPKPPNRGRAAV
jgi:putative N6-adenine-specific DNA methylase